MSIPRAEQWLRAKPLEFPIVRGLIRKGSQQRRSRKSVPQERRKSA